MLILTKESGKGRRKVCYDHPTDSTKIIKIVSHDYARFVGGRDRFVNFFIRINSFKTPLEFEFWKYNELIRKYGEKILEIIPRCYGFVDTNLGQGLVFDKILNQDETYSFDVKCFLKQKPSKKSLDQLIKAFEEFSEIVISLNVSIQDINLANYFYKKTDKKLKIMMVDIESFDHPRAMIPFVYIFFKRVYTRKRMKYLKKNLMHSINFLE